MKNQKKVNKLKYSNSFLFVIICNYLSESLLESLSESLPESSSESSSESESESSSVLINLDFCIFFILFSHFSK